MLKKRMLLLAAAMAAFGAMLVGSAFAFPAMTDNDTSDAVDVADPDGADVDVVQTDSEIPANNAWHKVADIQHQETDGDYAYTLTQLALTAEGGPAAGTCGTHDYAMDGPADTLPGLSLPVPGAWASTGASLFLKINGSGTLANCQISGATVEATFTVN